MKDNPVFNIDPLGDLANAIASTHTDEQGNVVAVYDDGDLGVYKHKKNADGSSVTKAQIDKRHENSTSAGGEKMGETVYWDEFLNFNNGKPEGRIIFSNDSRERWDQLISWGEDEAQRLGLLGTKTQSQLYGSLDIKNNKDWAPYGVMTGRLYKGKYISARSAGNYLAGYNGVTVPVPLSVKVLLGQQYITGAQYMKIAGLYQVMGRLPALHVGGVLLFGLHANGKYFGEENYSGRMIYMGIEDGEKSKK